MGYSKEYIAELMKYVDPHSLLIIGAEGKLIRIFTPFPVKVIMPIGKLTIGCIYHVEAVKITLDLLDVYIIDGKAYYLVYFKIVL